jgi:hypothetical protein
MPVGRVIASPEPYYSGHDGVAQAHQDVKAHGGEVRDPPQPKPGKSVEDQLAIANANIASVTSIPQRMYIQSVDRPDEVVLAQFNPEKLKETIGVDWQRFNIPGLTYQPQQYANTNNTQYRFKLVFSAAARRAVFDIGDGKPAIPYDMTINQIELARKRLLAWSVLRKDDRLGGIGDTQRLLFVWPNFISLTCNIVSVEFEYEQFNLEGRPVYFECDVLLEEVRDVALFAEDILAQGTLRSGEAAEKV